MQELKKPTIIETISLNSLRWFGHVQRMEQNRISKRVLYMNFGTTSLRGRPRNRWQDEVRVYANEKESFRILAKKEIYAGVKKKPTVIQTIRLNSLRWFGHVQRMEQNRIPKRILYMNFGTTS